MPQCMLHQCLQSQKYHKALFSSIAIASAGVKAYADPHMPTEGATCTGGEFCTKQHGENTVGGQWGWKMSGIDQGRDGIDCILFPFLGPSSQLRQRGLLQVIGLE